MAKRALCIGINDYPGSGMDLAGCVNDARDWTAALEARGFKVEVMLDKQATGKAMRQAIGNIVTGAAGGDTVALCYSGHGSYVPDENGDEPDGTDECLCPYDVVAKGPITDDELFELFSAHKPDTKVVMFSDSCHSGTVARFAPILTPPSALGPAAPQRKVRFMPPSVFLARRELHKLGIRRALRASSPPGRYGALLISGCQDTEYSADAYFQGRPNGAFSFVALRTLKTLPVKSTYLDWYEAIRKMLPSQQYPQTPNLFGSSSMKCWRVLA